MAIFIPLAAAGYCLSLHPPDTLLVQARVAVDGLVALASLLVLWSVRNNPSV
ncbi:MAG: hypothetical protein OEV47_11390 [Gammaproteobacteria bacterium]|jgi:hypothetical protein|nr:hypothetical protein [Gammaproteobacteria bacterium]